MGLVKTELFSGVLQPGATDIFHSHDFVDTPLGSSARSTISYSDTTDTLSDQLFVVMDEYVNDIHKRANKWSPSSLEVAANVRKNVSSISHKLGRDILSDNIRGLITATCNLRTNKLDTVPGHYARALDSHSWFFMWRRNPENGWLRNNPVTDFFLGHIDDTPVERNQAQKRSCIAHLTPYWKHIES